MNLFKKVSILAIILTLGLVSCKKEVVKKDPALFSIEAKTITINWIGYKTTDKTAVQGEFQEINILTSPGKDTTAVGALNGTTFEIPISSLFSNEAVRDTKLKELFFGVMDATNSLTGTLNLDKEGIGNIDLKMNGVQHKILVTYTVSSQMVELEGKFDLEDFNAQSALASISKACYELHTGADGVSKTWSEVGVKAAIYLKKK